MRNLSPAALGILAIVAATLAAEPVEAKYETDTSFPAARCAAFWSGMTRTVPEGSDPHAEMTQRKDSWLTLAKQQHGEARAASILNNNAPVYGREITAAAQSGGMPAVMERFADCEQLPDGAATTATSKQAISERERKGGELAIRCAGMARLYADTDNFIALEYYGREPQYRAIIDHFRPDMDGATVETAITEALIDHARILDGELSARRSNTMAGRENSVDDLESLKRAKECAQMINTLRAVNIID